MCRTSTTHWRNGLPHATACTALLLLAACSRAPAGAGISERRGVDAFHSIDLHGAAEVDVEVGPASSVELVADADILKSITTGVRNGMLVIESRPGWHWLGDSGGVRMHITLPVLNALAMNGAGNVTIHGIHGQAVSIALQGAGNLVATGKTAAMNARLNGAGNMDLSQLTAGDATLAVNGAGNLVANVTGSLQAEVNGVGSIIYAGKPRQVESNVNGVGRIVSAPGPTPQ
jgi:hypothetical protein